MQEALVEFARQAAVPENPRAWLYRVVKHRALNAARGARRRRDRETRAAGERLVAGAAAAFDRFEALAVAEALDRLQPTDRELVVLRIWGGLTFEEIAAAVGLTLSTAHRQYQQALELLRQILESPCSTNENPTTRRSRPS